MIMDEFSVYKMYLALRLHFTSDNYDVVEQQGRVKASRAAFLKRRDLYSIKKIAKTYSDEEVANFLVANFVSGDRWGGVFDNDAGKRYQEWKKRNESLFYIFNKDLDNLCFELEQQGQSMQDAFEVAKGQHPYIIKAYLRKTVSIETLVILEKIVKFVKVFDKQITDPVVWPDISRLIKKYNPFLTVELGKYDAEFRRRVRGTQSDDSQNRE